MNEQVFQLMFADIQEIKRNVTELVAFKYYVYGITAAIATAVSVAFKVMFK